MISDDDDTSNSYVSKHRSRPQATSPSSSPIMAPYSIIELFAKCTVYLNSVITDKSRSPKLKTDYCSAPGTGSIIAYTNGISDSDDENDAAYNSIFNTKFFLFIILNINYRRV